MTSNIQENQVQEQKPNDKELNFRALENKYQKKLDMERAARIEAERVAQEALSRKSSETEDDSDSEPYVDHKKLEKTLNKFGANQKQEIQSDIQRAINTAIAEDRKQNWINQNPDFYDVIQQNADKLYQHDKELAETILTMPDTFERQKLVYKNIKALGLHKAPSKEPSIQEKIDANRRSPYYQPSSVGTAPYAQVGDYSKTGQKNAYEKMQELKNKLRL